jgi:hypothetical protein
MNAGGEGNWERNPLGLSMDVAALKDHYSLLSPLRIGSSAVACRLDVRLPRGKEISPCCHASAPEIERNTDSIRGIAKKRCSRLTSVEAANTVMIHGEGSGRI